MTSTRGRPGPKPRGGMHIPGLKPLKERKGAEELTTEEVSAYIGYAENTLRRWRATHTGRPMEGPAWQPPMLAGRGYRGHYLARDVKAWLKTRRHP